MKEWTNGKQPCSTTGEQQQQSKNKMTNTRTTLLPPSQVLKTCDFGNFENCQLNIEITLIYPGLHPLMDLDLSWSPSSYVPCVQKSAQKDLPMPVGICTSGTYCLLFLPSMKEIFHFKGSLIDYVVGRHLYGSCISKHEIFYILYLVMSSNKNKNK